jgi:hypothetical protein
VSLFLQVFLFLTADMRRRSGSRVLMMLLWLAYLSADTVAIFVLGHLAVYKRGPSHELIFFWAPFVLVHLGGQDNITAFSKQDNELWMRHLLSLVSQVVVAGYVVSRSSWSDARLRAAMLLMFIRGFFKYAGRILCLYSARPKNLGALSLLRLSNTIHSLQHVQDQANHSSDDPGFHIFGARREEAKERIKERRFKAMFIPDKCWEFVSQSLVTDAGDIMSVDAEVNDVEIIVVADELPDMLEEFKNSPDRGTAYKYVGALLVQTYKYLYTKAPLFYHVDLIFYHAILPFVRKHPRVRMLLTYPFYLIHTLFQYLSTTIALVLFATAEKKRHYSQADIIVSYLLLVGAIVLDLLPVFTFIVSYTRKPFRPGTTAKWAIMCLINCFMWPLGWQTTKQWSEELSQYSMIRRYTSNAFLPSLRKWIGEFFDTTHTPVTDDLRLLVLDKLLLHASRKEWDFASVRGERALEKWMGSHQVPESAAGRSGYATLLNSVNMRRVDFPISVLIWHIATDICYFSEDKGHHTESDEVKKKKKMMSRELSLYVMYLVFKCDVMLTSISRLAHKEAHEGLKKFILGRQSPQGNLDEKEAIIEVLEAMKKEEQHQTTDKNDEPANKDDATTTSRFQELLRSMEEVIYSPVLPRACAVAEELMAIDDEAARWNLISEM